MRWAMPEHSRSRVDEAGKVYLDAGARREDREIALTVINNWRAAHGYPQNTFQMSIRRVASEIDGDPTVAQRIKRLPSIRRKLKRFSGMKLSRMQDIGGCRAVLSSVAQVDEMAEYYRAKSQIKHKLVREDQYIAEPKDSGYRGVHLVYSYYSDRNRHWNGLKTEIQIRTRLQHAWATAVETVETFTRQALKSSWGEKDWLRFFALMGSALAIRERTPLVPGTPHDSAELVAELRRYVDKLEVIHRLRSYGQALQLVEQETTHRAWKAGATFLLELDLESHRLEAWVIENPREAAEEYGAIERAIEGQPTKDTVLVGVESLAALRRAYPNYFLDTEAFLESVREAIK